MNKDKYVFDQMVEFLLTTNLLVLPKSMTVVGSV